MYVLVVLTQVMGKLRSETAPVSHLSSVTRLATYSLTSGQNTHHRQVLQLAIPYCATDCRCISVTIVLVKYEDPICRYLPISVF